jgi:hypothetical protein
MLVSFLINCYIIYLNFRSATAFHSLQRTKVSITFEPYLADFHETYGYHATGGYLNAILYNSQPPTKPTFGCGEVGATLVPLTNTVLQHFV